MNRDENFEESAGALQTAMKELESLRDARERTEEMVRTCVMQSSDRKNYINDNI